jgi:hypothetical protein
MAAKLARNAIRLEVPDDDQTFGGAAGEEVAAEGEAQADSLSTGAQAADERFGEVLGEEDGVWEGSVVREVTCVVAWTGMRTS